MPENGNITLFRMQKLVAIIFVSCIIIIFFTGFDTIKAKIRDVKRRADVKVLSKALDLYHDKYGKYPDSANEWQGWDLSIDYNGSQVNFIDQLEKEGLIDRSVKGPVNNMAYHYRYQKFKAGDFGCQNSFYILQVVNFELSTVDNGAGSCPEFNWLDSAPNGYTAQNFD